MTIKEISDAIKIKMNATLVNHSVSDELYDSFIVSGNGYLLIAIVHKSTTSCNLINPTSRKLVKSFSLKEGGAE